MAYGIHGNRAAVHSTPDTINTLCDGCPKFECIEQDRSRIHPWRFYCDAMGRSLEYRELFFMTEEDCPDHRRVRRRL